jgi:hypothetical protein
MKGRCRICGIVASDVTICNSCVIALEERRFLNMVNREELDSTVRVINRPKNSPRTDTVTEG